jgi:hypothetical protein
MRFSGPAFLTAIVVASNFGSARADSVPLPPPPIEIGTGTGGKLMFTSNVTITTGEMNNRLNKDVTWLIGGFVVYENATGGMHAATSFIIKAGGSTKAQITRVGAQFHWLIDDGAGKLVTPEVCEVVNTNVNVPNCTSGSLGIPARLFDLSTGVTLWATWAGQETAKQVDHAELQGSSY